MTTFGRQVRGMKGKRRAQGGERKKLGQMEKR
jgi:hypothetical protein